MDKRRKRRNPIARAVKRVRPQVIPNKKKYNKKKARQLAGFSFTPQGFSRGVMQLHYLFLMHNGVSSRVFDAL
jgi:hypothetical protein